MRHYCATRLLRTGIDIRKIQVHMSHKDISSTQEYTHLLTQDVQVEIYNLYAGGREPRFFPEIEETVICAV
jgi:site-specific recombinase XerD